MRRAGVVVMLVACGGTGKARMQDANVAIDARADAPVDVPIDVPFGTACNVLAQTGCSPGEKCTWIIDAATTGGVGHIGCAPDGTKASGTACTRNAPGATGWDDCVKGDYCFGPDIGGPGTCKVICDQAGGSPSCGSAGACTTYDGLFGPQGMAVAAGICDPTCDPIADNNFLGSAGNNRTGTMCGAGGSAVGAGFLYTKGCYGYPDGRFGVTKWTCTGQLNYSRVHRTACDTTIHVNDLAPCAPSAGSVYVNGCAAGYEPTFLDSEGSTIVDCMAMCRPASCYNTGSAGSAGSSSCGTGAAANITGTAPGQCVASRLQYASFDQVDPTSTWSAASPTVNNGEQCFYSWPFEFDSAGNFVPSPTSDTVGFCVDHSKYLYDSAGSGTAGTVWPRCDQVGLGSGGYNVLNKQDATTFGCVDTATARAAGDLAFTGKAAFVRPPLRMPYHHIAKAPF